MKDPFFGRKQELEILARHMFGREDALIQLDMSEYMEKFAVSRMTGSPPGYVGHDEGGQLTEQVRMRPYSVVLFDEVEKAHPDVMNMLLQILEEGRLTDSTGRKVDFRNTIVIMTSNIGADLIRKGTEIGFGVNESAMDDEKIKSKILAEVNKKLKPEFVNRFDGLVIFRMLTKENLKGVLDIELKKVLQRLKGRDVEIELTEAAEQFLIDKGFQPEMGARPLRRKIEEFLVDPLTDELLRFPDESRRYIVAPDKKEDPEKLVFELQSSDEKPKKKPAKKAKTPA